jgi:hypothetical protein
MSIVMQRAKMLAAAITLTTASLTWAEQLPGGSGQGRPAQSRAGQARPGQAASELPDPGEVNRLFDAYAIMQAQETLQLDEAKFGSFVTRLKALQQLRRRNMRARGQIIQDLQRMLRRGDGPPDDAPNDVAVRERLDALARQDATAAAEIKRAYDAVDELLDVRQRARFRVFEHQLELKKLDLLARVRQQIRANRARP